MASIQKYYSKELVSLPPDASVVDAGRLMGARTVGSVVVMEGGRPAGIVTERDLVAQVVVPAKPPERTTLAEVMVREVPSVEPAETAEACSALMAKTGARYLFVRQADAVIGIVSLKDVIRALLEERESEVRQLTAYVTGGR